MPYLSFFLTCLFTSSICFAAIPDFPQVSYGPEARQYADIYIAPSDDPTPVYFDAHGNGGNTSMPDAIVDDLMAAGISIVAWESLTSINTPDQVETGWADAELMFAWVKANAATYNFDTTNFIIGGSSRGSILSWKYGHRGDPNVKGLYMYNALPNGVWADSSWWYAPDEVKMSSPPIFFVYRFEPGVTNDSHDPANGLLIMDTYDSLGIGERDTMVHSIGYSANTDKYQFLVEFALAVIDFGPVLSVEPGSASPKYTAYPNPFQDKVAITGLQGGETFALYSLNGDLLKQGHEWETLDLSDRIPGFYYLRIRRVEEQQVLKLVKQ